ncbi:hypothetical protein H4S06_000534 [Coemansia sp. BCRC 34490]|nr:hypothetical protein LPJ72_002779 [Coemansia sp. Benny D160-2]KAJ2613888.1 hypothetical protein EV177_002320 [Coemansia sp. RSA 1804]KAJ2762660.1 hypothetical protein H4S06_000534 [Coemansia sp. BCRC 34490]
MSMFSKFDKDLKCADGCLHKAADMFFHPIKEDIFHKWDTNHPPFPGPKLTKVRLECKEEVKKEEVKVVVKEEVKCTCTETVVKSCGDCHCCCTCKCEPAPPPPPPPPPSSVRIYPCFKVIDKYAIVETEWFPTMKDYSADKVWQLHAYLPDAAKDKIIIDIIEKTTLVIHGEGVFHSHCGMWPEHVEHCCDCTRKDPTPFCKKFALPANCKIEEARVEFEKEVLVVRIQRG